MHRFGRCKSEFEQTYAESERAPRDPAPCTATRKDTAAPARASHEWKWICPEWERAELQLSFKINLNSFKAAFLSLAKLEQSKKEAEVSC